jgi:hypothetical protein
VSPAVRRLGAHEAGVLSDVRLRALRDTPTAFGSSLAREEGYAAAGFSDTGRREPLGHSEAFVAVLEPPRRALSSQAGAGAPA